MNERIKKLREARFAILKQARGIVELAETDGRSLTTEEMDKVDSLRQEATERLREINTLEELEAEEMRKIVQETEDRQREADGQFESLGDFVRTVITNPNDPRLRELTVEGSGSAALVPMEFASRIMEVATAGSIVEPLATVIPAGEKPDASVTIPTVDYSENMYGGIVVEYIGEGDPKPVTDMAFDDLVLDPKELAAHTVITDKLLRNAPVVETILVNNIGKAMAAKKDEAYLQGAVGGPTGIIGHAGTVVVPRDTANTINYADICNIMGRFLSESGVWVVAGTALPVVMQMEDSAGHLIWQPNAAVSPTGAILGEPLRKSRRIPTLGNEGDIGLYDFSAYVIKQGYGLAFAKSEHVYFTRNKTVLKAFLLHDGAPWIKAPLEEEDGTEVSPFVVLGDPVSA